MYKTEQVEQILKSFSIFSDKIKTHNEIIKILSYLNEKINLEKHKLVSLYQLVERNYKTLRSLKPETYNKISHVLEWFTHDVVTLIGDIEIAALKSHAILFFYIFIDLLPPETQGQVQGIIELYKQNFEHSQNFEPPTVFNPY